MRNSNEFGLTFQNGYPSRRRSLVGDARFETQQNKENKRNWLQEIRQLSRDSELSEDDLILVDDDSILVSPTLEEEEAFVDVGCSNHVETAFKSAATATTTVAEVNKDPTDNTQKPRQSVSDKAPEEATIVLTLRDGMLSLITVLKTIEVSTLVLYWFTSCFSLYWISQEHNGQVVHMESRPSREQNCQFDILLKMQIPWSNLVGLLRALRQMPNLYFVNVISTQGHIVKGNKVSISYTRHARNFLMEIHV